MNLRMAMVLLLILIATTPRTGFAQCEDWVQGPIDDGTLPTGSNGEIFASMNWDPDGAGPLAERLVVGGNFDTIGGVVAKNIAQYNPSTGSWEAFGGGITPSVYSLTVFNGQVVAGCGGDNNVGTFDHTAQRWTGSAWEYLSATNTGSVWDLAVYNGSLYIAGTFMTQFVVGTSNPAFYIARWDAAANLWDAVEEADFGTFTGSQVRALEVFNGELYAAGTNEGNTHISRGGDGSPWTTITDGTSSGGVEDLAVFAGELLIAGGFLDLNGLVCHNFAGWNGSSFRSFGNGVSSGAGVSSRIYSVKIYNGIVIGGDFITAGSVTANHVAFWPPGGSAWQALGGGTDDRVYDLTSYRGQLIAVGIFTNANGPAADIARWNGTQWGPLTGGNSVAVLAMVPYRGRMVGGGEFIQSTESFGTASNIASWNGSELREFGTGMNSIVWSLESFKYPGLSGDYELIAAGQFTVAGGVAANRIARWREDPLTGFPAPAWEPMGVGFNSTVEAIERWGSTTYAGGLFSHSGATAVNSIARWNETTDVWENIGGTNGGVYAIKEYNGALYVAGTFTTAGGISSPGIARWNGSSWSSFGVTGAVFALGVHDGKLIIGGQFTAFGATNLIAYDGVSAFPLVAGTDGAGVRSILSAGDRLYVGGSFAVCGGVPAANVAWYDGTWHPLGSGVNAAVNALGRLANETHVGGFFSSVDGGTLISPRWARFTETGLPFFTLHPSSKTASLGASESFSAGIGGGFPGPDFQWFHDDLPLSDGLGLGGSVISGALTQVLTISNIVSSDQGAYRVEVGNGCGSISSATATLSIDATAAPRIDADTAIFRAIGPNPTDGRSVLFFSLTQDTAVSFSVYDLRGRLVRHIDVGRRSAGHHQVGWDTKDKSGDAVAAGVYFISLELNEERFATKRLTVIR